MIPYEKAEMQKDMVSKVNCKYMGKFDKILIIHNNKNSNLCHKNKTEKYQS